MSHLELLRIIELELAVNKINKHLKKNNISKAKILEIGGGAGWQAKKLSEKGFNVESIEISDSMYKDQRMWPILEYDGENIPFKDNTFDVVFSSNVIEHIKNQNKVQKEIHRVLKINSLAIHLVPTSQWRFLTIVNHYPFMLKTFFSIFFKKILKSGDEQNDQEKYALNFIKNISIFTLIKNIILAPLHGETGVCSISELHYFSKKSWTKLLKSHKWKIEDYSTNELFYSGYMILGEKLSMRKRKKLSKYFGSSCHIFVLRKENNIKT